MSPGYNLPWSLHRQPVSYSATTRFQRDLLARSFERTWDRVDVLGDNDNYGHAGCVNALHWTADDFLISSGDDTTVQIWAMDSSLSQNSSYPFICRSVIYTGHKANIFNVNMLPYSTRIVTVAGDRKVQVFDVGKEYSGSPGQDRQEYSALHARTHRLSCHEDRVKRIATEESPDKFLTVSEDGTVRQHDLRTAHTCRTRCPGPLVQVSHDLSTIATANLAGFYVVVAGESPYGYLFDRRYTGRDLQDEWGMKADGLATCVRRFGRSNQAKVKSRVTYPGEHITGARMSTENGHEILLSYSADAVYLFSTLDEPQDQNPSSSSSGIIPPNSKRRQISRSHSHSRSPSTSSTFDSDPMEFMDMDTDMAESDIEHDRDGSDEDDEEEDGEEPQEFKPWIPVVHPRRRYAGARNTDTVKDVNFLGPRDEYVASGSDDGNFFVWNKSTGKLHGLYEGDGSVVNVIEQAHHIPLVAVSGIDHTVKLFAPVKGDSESIFSRISNAESIMERNHQRSNIRTIRRLDLVALLSSVRAATLSSSADVEEAASDCVNQ